MLDMITHDFDSTDKAKVQIITKPVTLTAKSNNFALAIVLIGRDLLTDQWKGFIT